MQGRRHPCLDGKVANKYDLANLHFITALSTHSIMPTPVCRSSTRPLQPQTIQRERVKTGSQGWFFQLECIACQLQECEGGVSARAISVSGSRKLTDNRTKKERETVTDRYFTRSPGFIDVQSVSASVQSRRSHCPLVALLVPSLRQRPSRCHHDRPRKTASLHKGSPAPASSSCSGQEGEQST